MGHIKNGDIILFKFPRSMNTYIGKILNTEILEKAKWYDIEYFSIVDGPSKTSIPSTSVTCKVSAKWFEDLADGGLNVFEDYRTEYC